MSRRRHWAGAIVTLVTLVTCDVAGAQGAIATQGYGYPPGQVTTRAASAGGALADFDQAGPSNPAALMNWGVAGAYMQYAPEFRRSTAGGTTVSATVPRFPVFSVGLPMGPKFTLGISASTMLERNYINISRARQRIRNDSVTTFTADTTRGSMSDLQFAGAMQVRRWLRVGSALHVITGANRVRVARFIAPDSGAAQDSLSVTESSTNTFTGSAVSFGVELQPIKTLAFAGTARLGFGMRSEFNDSTRLSANTPNRASASVRWDIGNSSLAGRIAWDGWSALRGISGRATVFDTREFGIGAELPGPKIKGGQMLLRVGARNRTLPFGVGGVQPEENILGGGLGLPVGFGRAQLDVGIERASRRVPGVSGITERGLILSFGFRLRT